MSFFKKISILFLILLLFFISFSIYRIHGAKIRIYNYNVKSDYNYDLNSSTKVFNVQFSNNNLIIPDIEKGSFDTAILEINIQSDLLGNLIEPYIDMKSSKLDLKEYFEYGAKGKRYLNISKFINKDDKKIHLISKFCSIEKSQNKLYLFKNKDIEKTKILLISPHPDDSEIAAYGLYSDNSMESYILTVTAGDAGKFKYDEIYSKKKEHFLQKAKLRIWNSITVPMLGGIDTQHSFNLGYFDGTLHKLYFNKDKIIKSLFTDLDSTNYYRNLNFNSVKDELGNSKSKWSNLVNDIEFFLKKVKPKIIVAPYPAIDSHPDHKFTTIATLEAMKRLDMKDVQLLLYTNHHKESEGYPFGEMHSVVPLPPIVKEPIYFNSILSYPLSMEKQSQKIFALESMNDLRLDTEWLDATGNMKNSIKSARKQLSSYDLSYFRRAIRSNELFFVINSKEIFNNNIQSKIIGDIDYLNSKK